MDWDTTVGRTFRSAAAFVASLYGAYIEPGAMLTSKPMSSRGFEFAIEPVMTCRRSALSPTALQI